MVVVVSQGETSMVELLAGERKERENHRAIQACNDYLMMGPGRSLQKLLNRYQIAPETPPTKRIKTLKDWSAQYEWQARAALYDTAIQEQKITFAAEALQTGLASTYERVLALKKLAGSLTAEIWEPGGKLVPGNVWLNDAKQIGKGSYAERIDLIRFNAPLIEQYRGVLDDLARETGGRKQQFEHSGPGGGPIKTEDVGLTDEERLARISILLNKAGAGGTGRTS